MAHAWRAAQITGRGREMTVLDSLIAAVRAGESRVLVVRGEPGAGKTVLLDYLAEHGQGCRVLRAAGMQSEMEFAFAGLHQLLAPVLDHLERLPAPQQEALRTVFGISAGAPPDRFLVALAVLSLLSEAATERPLVCVIDDEQWLDQASAQALGFAARRLAADPVGLVFAARVPGDELTGLPDLVVGGLADGDARALPGGFGLPGAGSLNGRIEESLRRQLGALPPQTRLLLVLTAAEPPGNAPLVWRAAGLLGLPPAATAPAAEAGLVEFGALSDQAEHAAPACNRLLLGCRIARDLWDHGTWSRLSGQLVAEARRTGELAVLPGALHNGAMAQLLAGNAVGASAMARQADAVAQAAGITAGPYSSLALAAWSGAEAAVERLLATVAPRMTAQHEGRWLTAGAWATAVVSNGLGRYEEALAAAEEGAAGAVGLGLTAWSIVELIEAAARLGQPERACAALGRLAGMAAASESDWARGLLARSQALMTEDGAAEEHYRRAISLLDRAGVEAEAARARLLYGEWLRRRMRRRDARAQLREAHQRLAAMGAAGFAERARGELMATGETARQRVPETARALTAQEAQIARLAADGLTNPEIGMKLFISARTVEWHLRKVYVKLGVSSRRRLRDALPGSQPMRVLAAW